MTISWRTPGAWTAGSTSVSSIPLPASIGAGNRMYLFVGAKPYNATINEPSGWTRIGTQQTNGTTGSGVDTGSVTWSVFYRDWQSGDGAVTVSITSGNVALACIHGAIKTKSAWDTQTAYFGSDTSSGTDYSITAASSSGNITNGDGLIHFSVIAGNNSTFGTPTIAATSATIGTVTESPATEGTTTTGNDLEASSASALCTAGTSSADAVCGWTLSVAQTGGSALVRVREVATTHETTGALTGPGSAIAGTAAHVAKHATTGALTGQGSTVAGAATRFRAHAASGVLPGGVAAVAGAAARFKTHTSSGGLSGQGSTISGVSARFRTFLSGGVLTGQGSALQGSAARFRTLVTSGALAGQGSTIEGSATHASGATEHTVSGALAGQGASVSGVAALESSSPQVEQPKGGMGWALFMGKPWKRTRQELQKERERLGIFPKPAARIRDAVKAVAKGEVSPAKVYHYAKVELEKANLPWDESYGLMLDRIMRFMQEQQIQFRAIQQIARQQQELEYIGQLETEAFAEYERQQAEAEEARRMEEDDMVYVITMLLAA